MSATLVDLRRPVRTVVRVTPTEHAAQLIVTERVRQQLVEGWTIDNDRLHGPDTLAAAAHCYATSGGSATPPPGWPWDTCWWKPKSTARDLVRAGALYQAALDVTDPGDVERAVELTERREQVTRRLSNLLAQGLEP